MSSRSAASSPSLTATLRSMSDEALAGLLRRRPDLAVPQPTGFEVLATRARTALSVSRALDLLDEFTLRVFDGLRVVASSDDGGPATSAELLVTVTPDVTGVPPALHRLRELALVWGPDKQLRFSDAAAEAAGPYPAGLGRPAAELDFEAEALAADPAALRRAV
ncbi:MAG: helicase-associated domain-containing protein, partial [Stackebrandtia sp.]